MLARVLDPQAQVATALIQVECACLENRPLSAAVKILERDEIATELDEVAMVADQSVEAHNCLRVTFLGFVPGDQRGERFFRVSCKNFPNPVQLELLDRTTGLCATPGLIASELGVENVPNPLQ